MWCFEQLVRLCDDSLSLTHKVVSFSGSMLRFSRAAFAAPRQTRAISGIQYR
jgi:hypothetical protein